MQNNVKLSQRRILMSIQWFSKKESNQVATIYDSNITLNKIASDYFNKAYEVMLGFDEPQQEVVIKPLDKETVQLGHIPSDQRSPISVWESSARIANKAFIKQLSQQTGLQFKKSKAHKFYSEWDEAMRVLRIKLQEEIK